MAARREARGGSADRAATSPPRVVMWAHLPPAGGGPTRVARNLAADPDLNARFRMEFRGTHEASPDRVGRIHLHNVWRALRDAGSMFRQVRGASVVEVFSSGHTTMVLVRALLLTIAARLAGAKVLLFLGSGRLYPSEPSEFVPTRGMPQMYRVLSWLVASFVIIDDLARPVLAPMVGRARVEMIPPPLDEDRFTAPPRSATTTPVLVHAGRITREKGVLDLLEACRLLDERGTTSWELRLVGPLERSTTGELGQIERTAEDLGRVTFVGWVDDISPELAKGDVFVSASHREGLSGSIAEAAMSGLPVVASDVGAVNTIVRDGLDGFVVPPHEPVAFADALQRVVEDPALRLEMGERARHHSIDLYGRERIAARYAALIGELV